MSLLATIPIRQAFAGNQAPVPALGPTRGLFMTSLIEILLRSGIVVLSVIALTRLHGLRSFSKMSSFDFAITVAFGSVIAGAVTTLSTPAWHFIVALAGLFGVQIVIARLRVNSERLEEAVDNAPLLIMENGQILTDNLRKGNMTPDDLWGKLREANALTLDQVHAVVLESTGDVSVLHGPPDGPRPCDEVLSNVRRN